MAVNREFLTGKCPVHNSDIQVCVYPDIGNGHCICSSSNGAPFGGCNSEASVVQKAIESMQDQRESTTNSSQ